MKTIMTSMLNLVKLSTKKSTKKSLIDNFLKSLLEFDFKTNHSIIARSLNYALKKYLHYYKTCKLIAQALEEQKQKCQYSFGRKNIQNYCLSCRNHTDNIGSKKVAMKVLNKLIIDKSKCADYAANKPGF